MNSSKNQEGYALVIVLLMVVLFLGISATFMAGSINHAKQEQTVDTTNQSVASAEMGVRYYSADFQREIGIVKSEIIETTQNRLKSIVECFKSGDSSCDEPTELKELEKEIDKEMKAEYILKIKTKVEELEALKDIQKSPFPGEDVHYAVAGTAITEMNANKEDVNLSSTGDKIVNWLKVELELEGDSKGVKKYLKGIFTVEVPDTFLSEDESLTVKTTTVNNSNLDYHDVFSNDWPAMKCSELTEKIKSGETLQQNECLLGSDMKAAEFVEFLKNNNHDPKDYKVFTSDFKNDICGNSCNNQMLEGISVVVENTDVGLDEQKGGNTNSLNNINLIVDGYFEVKNLNSLGKKTDQQTLIFKELTVTSNVQGQGIMNTNLVILGKDYEKDAIKADSIMYFQKNLTIGDNGRICFDLDRILPKHVEQLSGKVSFSNNNTTGQIIYYSSNLQENTFVLKDKAYKVDKDRTLPYVTGYDKYTDFLSSCGVSVNKIVTSSLEIPYAHVMDPIFGLEVEY
ncbi:hypothetical protein [Planococcus plakortidis]|uniref:hypothetical protein n=1 Tax=Planococcus plakortidis TaxID=1038856 RepID=UPI0039853748